MSVTVKEFKAAIGIILISLFCFTNGLHDYLYGGETFAIVTLFLGILLLLWVQPFAIRITYHILWVFLLILIMLVNNQDNAHYGSFVFNTVFYVALWLMYCVMCFNDAWHRIFLKMLVLFGMFHAACTWLFYFLPSLYTGKIAPLFPETMKSLLEQYENGWMPGLTPSYSTNGIYLGVTACAVVSILIVTTQRKKVDVLAAILIISALLITGKRAQTLALAAGFLVLYYVYNNNEKQKRIYRIILIGILVVVGLFVAAKFVPSLMNVITRFERETAAGDVTVGRMARFLEAWNLFKENPMWGIGWNGSLYYFEQVEEIIINVHNIYLQLLCETGIVGSLCYFTFFGYNLFWAIKLVIACGGNQLSITDTTKKAICVALCIEVFFLVYGLTGNPLYDYQSLFPYLGACAIVGYCKRNYWVPPVKEDCQKIMYVKRKQCNERKL